MTCVTLYLVHTHHRGEFIPDGEPGTVQLREALVTFWYITTPEEAEADLRAKFPECANDADYEVTHESAPGATAYPKRNS